MHPGEGGVRFNRARDRRNRDPALAVERLEGVCNEIGEHLGQLMVIAFDHRQPGLHPRRDRHLAARRLRFRHRHRLLQHVGEVRSLDLQPHRTDELEHLDDNRVGKLRLAEDVGEQRLGVLRVGHLAAQKSRHHFDASQWILQLVRDPGRHLAERSQAIAQPLALLELFDSGQVLEEQDRADRRAVIVLHLRERVADHAIEVLQSQLRAIRQMAELERAREDADDLGPLPQHVRERAPDIAGAASQSKDVVRLVVHQGERAVAAERDDAVAHAADDVAEEPIGGRRAWRLHGTPISVNGRRGRARLTAPTRSVGSLRHVRYRFTHGTAMGKPYARASRRRTSGKTTQNQTVREPVPRSS